MAPKTGERLAEKQLLAALGLRRDRRVVAVVVIPVVGRSSGDDRALERDERTRHVRDGEGVALSRKRIRKEATINVDASKAREHRRARWFEPEFHGMLAEHR